jgi:hypothetical protein
MTNTLTDIFVPASPSTTRPTVAGDADTEGVKITQPDPDEVEANFQRMSDRTAAARRAATARKNAATAREVAQAFGEYGRAFRKVAATKGSHVDHAVAVALAAYCEAMVDEYTTLQTESTARADREGSL